MLGNEECPHYIRRQVISPSSFTPWFDRDGGYYAILGMEVTESQSGIVALAVNLEQTLKPLIRNAL